MKVVLASGNPGKLREFAALLGPLEFELISQTDLGIAAAAETGTTFQENALIKARHAAALAQLPALADDSGLEADALGGRPGVYSARYAGEGASDADNLQRLLRELRYVQPPRRSARYRCVLALVRGAEEAQPLIAEGIWEGSILEAPRGTGGFGYDPIFLPSGSACSAAELPASQKNAHSHRARALAALVAQLQPQARRR